jgi:uncharacterized protein
MKQETASPGESAAQAAPTRPFNVLALSGGGIRGLYTATVLKELEDQFGHPLAKHFDLICGTSAGGLLALGLAAEIPAADLQAMFETGGPKIFNSRSWLRKLAFGIGVAKHSADGLRAVLAEKFKDKTIGDLKHPVLIPSVNYSKGGGQFFKTPHSPNFYSDHKHRLVDVGLATAAAPVYFPMHEIADQGVFVDGGLVGNSPGFFGLHEAHHVFKVPRGPGNVRVLSVGTMALAATKRGGSGLDWGIWKWKFRLFDLVISAQETSVNTLLTHLLGSDYLRIDDPATPDQSKDIARLDQATPAAIATLKFRGMQAAKQALGSPALEQFRNHRAAESVFFHGPNQNVTTHA